MGLLDNIDNFLGTRIGLLVNDPRAAINKINQDAGIFNQASLLATQAERNSMRNLPITAEQLAAKQYVDRVNENLAMGFAGTVGSSSRVLPLPTMGEITKFSGPLPKGDLYRELSANKLLNMASSSSPMGNPVTMFAEKPEMALGQNANKGIMFKIESEGITGKPYLDKPGLGQAYLQKSGEFEIKENPSRLLSAINEIWVSPEAYKNISKSEKIRISRMLSDFEKSGVKVNKVDVLPGR
jgi:hypothetical protein